MSGEFVVEKILEKRVINGNEEYRLKWENSKRSSWVSKSDLNCDELLLNFERSLGPKILGAMRDSNVVRFLVHFEGQEPKETPLFDAKKFAVNVIDFLESKIIWHDATPSSNEPFNANALIKQRNAIGEIIYAMNSRNGIIYFFQYEDGEIAAVESETAIVKFPQLVLDYLSSRIE